MMNLLYILFLITWFPSKEPVSECNVFASTNVVKPICDSEESPSVFKVETNCDLGYLKTVVYNRWGQKVFEEVNSNNGFDGKRKKKCVEEGVYFYVIEYQVLGDSDKLTLKGHLTVTHQKD